MSKSRAILGSKFKSLFWRFAEPFSVKVPFSDNAHGEVSQPVRTEKDSARMFERDGKDSMAKTVLLIEDSVTFRALLSSTLATQRYSVISAENGESGIRRAAKDRPDIIILDLSLPDMSGAAVLASLKSDAQTAHMPVVICTASVDGELRDEVLQKGADEIFTKPVTPRDLFAALQRHLPGAAADTARTSGRLPTRATG
jgi:CheY-like chemotaxis protein